jgi:hypothetical protein
MSAFVSDASSVEVKMPTSDESSGMYLVDERPIERENDNTILNNDELKDHVAIINHSLEFISNIPKLVLHTNVDELFVQRLLIRCFNSGASSLRLARCGYYQPAFAMIRDVVETTFLLDLFNRQPAEIARWHSLPAKQREKEFAPFRVRDKLDKADGNKERRRAAAYKALSTYASHPTPEGFHIISPNLMTQIGPFPNADRIEAFLQELAKNISYAAIVAGGLVPKDSDAGYELKKSFLRPLNFWLERYMPSAAKVVLPPKKSE